LANGVKDPGREQEGEESTDLPGQKREHAVQLQDGNRELRARETWRSGSIRKAKDGDKDMEKY